jgi:hypothetical protein
VAAPIVALGHDVEEKGLHVIVEGLVIQEELGHQAEVLAVDLVLLAVYLRCGTSDSARVECKDKGIE